MYAAVVEFDTLTDSVRAAAQNHYLRLALIRRGLIGSIVGAVIICTLLRSGYMYAFPGFGHADGLSGVSDIVFGYTEDLA